MQVSAVLQSLHMLTIDLVAQGGVIAAIFHLTALRHMSTTLAKWKQPDIRAVHIDFLNMTPLKPCKVVVTELRTASAMTFLNLVMEVDGKTTARSTVTTMNFDWAPIPTVPTDWKLLPEPKPVPDWRKVAANEAEENWIPLTVYHDVIPFTRRMTELQPRGGMTKKSIVDTWQSFNNEKSNSTTLSLLSDLVPTMPETMAETGTVLDINWRNRAAEEWAAQNPGKPWRQDENTVRPPIGDIWSATSMLTIEFVRRLPPGGLDWVFHRLTTREYVDGRGDIEILMCDDQMRPVCVSHHVLLALSLRAGSQKFLPRL